MKKSEIFSLNKNSVLLLETAKPLGNGQHRLSIRGSGFVVSTEGSFITNAHVYKNIPDSDKQYLYAKLPGRKDKKGVLYYKTYNVELIDIDFENDIALMKLVDKGKTKFKAIKKFADAESVVEGDEVMFMGYPLATELLKMGFGLTLSANYCIVSAVKRRAKDGSLHFFMIDTHINSGSSGSPLFAIETGEVVGLASGKISTKIEMPDKRLADVPSNMGICRPSRYILDILEKNEIE